VHPNREVEDGFAPASFWTSGWVTVSAGWVAAGSEQAREAMTRIERKEKIRFIRFSF